MARILGTVNVLKYLTEHQGQVQGEIVTDAKLRRYEATYDFVEDGDYVLVSRKGAKSNPVSIPSVIDLDRALVAFFGLYSGDGSKGTDDPTDPSRLRATISFSQREKNLVRFALDQFSRIFPRNLEFVFSLGEDSAYFLDGEGKAKLVAHLANGVDDFECRESLESLNIKLSDADRRYLGEKRDLALGPSEGNLAFYYQFKNEMETILRKEKEQDLISAGLELGPYVSVRASLRRPFKKGARQPGGSSRSDEMLVSGLSGLGELFLKIMHEIEESIASDKTNSTSGLISWDGVPSQTGEEVSIPDFLATNPYGCINGKRAVLSGDADWVAGRWPSSSEVLVRSKVLITPLFCYTSGLYLAEGSTPKSVLFNMYLSGGSGFSFGFTSSEGMSLELTLRTLMTLFRPEDCLNTWKVKVGSQYFPELVLIGLKQGVSMLRGGDSGDGKLRTIELSLTIKEWALSVADAAVEPETSLLRRLFANKFSHLEPTGAGVARIDISASSSICRWIFPLMMFCVFGESYADPKTGFFE